jgi:YVTN family beta-propeller protein
MGSFAFVTNLTSRSISVIDTATNAVVAEITVVTKPFAIAVAS